MCIRDRINYYQTDWNLIGLRLQNKDNLIQQYPLINFGNAQNKVWITWIPKTAALDEGVILLVDNLQGYCSIYNEFGQFLGNLELNEEYQTDIPLTLIDILSSTGLQIKTDPGIPLIYTGFLFLMISTLISYITYSQIWVIQNQKKLFVGGTTTRATYDFEIEFFKLIKI